MQLFTHPQTDGWGKSLWSSPGCEGYGCACARPHWPQPALSGPPNSWCSGLYLSAHDLASHSDCQLQGDTDKAEDKIQKKEDSEVRFFLWQLVALNNESYRETQIPFSLVFQTHLVHFLVNRV